MKNTLSIRTVLRKDKMNQGGLSPIYLSISLNKKKFKLSTGQWLEEKDWNFDQSAPKRKFPNLKRKLRLDVMNLEDFFLEKTARNEFVTPELIKNYYKGEDDYDFYVYFDKFLKSKSKKVRHSTMKSYHGTYRAFKEFKSDLLMAEIDLKLIKRFDSYLRDDIGLADGGAWNRHKNIKAVLNKAKEDGVLNSNPYDRFSVKRPKSKNHFLDEDDLMSISVVPWLSESLELTKDRFLLSCYTGLRFSDINTLKWEHIQKDGTIRKLMIKTDKYITLPISPVAKALLDKYKGLGLETVFPRISNQKVNKGLKKIAELSEVRLDLTFHVARHSFGYLLGKSGVNAFKIMELMGHAKINQSVVYVNANTSDLEDAMKNVPFFNA
ncbi:MAG: site-specific integrase [Fluviicola sp.]|nr:site-specific integrase [Fluviicola sp.]